jgi:hypothetical protein
VIYRNHPRLGRSSVPARTIRSYTLPYVVPMKYDRSGD